jgi:agmatinase
MAAAQVAFEMLTSIVRKGLIEQAKIAKVEESKHDKDEL